INGKVRYKLEDMDVDLCESDLAKIAMSHPNSKKWLYNADSDEPKSIIKMIHVPNKLLNIIVK
ncbi:hypothetical protein LPJ73_003847, partial [Coemansia sp. RSA 2703]